MADKIIPDIWEKVQQVNKILQDGEPNNISVDSYSGYTGYKPQFVVDAMNQVFGPLCWGFEEVSSDLYGNPDPNIVFAKIQAWVVDTEVKRPAWGQSRITKGDLGDARKGAQTDGLKKALSYFSVGSRAYQGLLPGAKTPANKPQAGYIAPSKPEVKNFMENINQIKSHADAEILEESIRVAGELTGQDKYNLYQQINDKKKQLSTIKI